MTYCSALGGFLFGYDTGVISGALLLLQNPTQMNLNDIQSSSIVASTVFGAILGACCGNRLNTVYGRRGVILLSSIIFTVGK